MFENGGTSILGLILHYISRRNEKLFRHSTRQLTSSAPAKEVMLDHYYEYVYFLSLYNLEAYKTVGLFIM